jgi:hypothetical protein
MAEEWKAMKGIEKQTPGKSKGIRTKSGGSSSKAGARQEEL